MEIKTYAIVVIVTSILSFSMGRYSVKSLQPQSAKVNTTSDINTHEHKVVVITKKVNGDIVTTITDDLNRQNKSQSSSITKQIPEPTVNVAALLGVDIENRMFRPTYGISVTKKLLGPITIGVFGLSSGVGGFSIGINF